MDKKQYNNIIFGTVKREKTLKGEPMKMVRKICNNMGVALPQGDCKEIQNTLKAGGFMAWRRCSAREAQAAANSGIAAIAISENSIAMLSADTAEASAATDEATATSAVMTLSAASASPDVEYYSYGTGVVTTDENTSTDTPQPHGTYITFTCEQAAVCNDGIGNSYGDKNHQNQTAYMNGILNADIHRYIVIPKGVTDYSQYKGCVGVAIRENGNYVFGVVGEVGPIRDPGVLDEFSYRMICDLAFNTDGANYVSPKENVTTYIFVNTKRSSWPSDTLNEDVEAVGRQYFY